MRPQTGHFKGIIIILDSRSLPNNEMLLLSTLVHKYGNQDSFTQRVAIFRLSHLDHDG
jgi:hypothetical protein